MRTLALWRLVAILLLAVVPLAGASAEGPAPAALAAQGNGNDDSDDGNRGHGNDPDGVDEDNPGNSGNAKETKDKEKDAKEKPEKGGAVEAVPGAGYVVAVACHPTEDGLATACEISATAPDGASEVGMVQLPAEVACAEVVDTDAEFADPDPNTHVTGYTSRGSEGSLSLTLDGAVTTAGTATYWITTGDGIVPVEGPGLRCEPAADAAATEASASFTVDATPTPPPATGSIAVAVLTCAEVPADTTGFDWFGQCQPGADPPRELAIAPGDGSAAPATATTDAAGEATFGALAPGEYRLELVDGAWCHAASDAVTAESEVVVEAGATATVWIFLCDGTAGA
jgi:hypothetical protein